MAPSAAEHRGPDPSPDGSARPHAIRHAADSRHPESRRRNSSRQEGAKYGDGAEIACTFPRVGRPAAATAEEGTVSASSKTGRGLNWDLRRSASDKPRPILRVCSQVRVYPHSATAKPYCPSTVARQIATIQNKTANPTDVVRGLSRRSEGRGAESISGGRISRRLNQALNVVGYQAIGCKILGTRDSHRSHAAS